MIDEETVQKVLAVLSDDVSEMPKNWNRRFKHNRDKIKTGDIYELAEVVRNLAVREHEKGLSTGEKQMFTRAKKILASELMYALDMDEDGGRGAPRQPARRVRGREGPPRRSQRVVPAVALVVAAGRGERLGSDGPKAFVPLAGRPMLEWSIAALRAVAGDRADRRRAARRRRGARGLHRRRRRRRALALGAQRAGRRRRGRRRSCSSTTRRARC